MQHQGRIKEGSKGGQGVINEPRNTNSPSGKFWMLDPRTYFLSPPPQGRAPADNGKAHTVEVLEGGCVLISISANPVLAHRTNRPVARQRRARRSRPKHGGRGRSEKPNQPYEPQALSVLRTCGARLAVGQDARGDMCNARRFAVGSGAGSTADKALARRVASTTGTSRTGTGRPRRSRSGSGLARLSTCSQGRQSEGAELRSPRTVAGHVRRRLG